MRKAIEAALRDRPATGYLVVADAEVAAHHEIPLPGAPCVTLAGGADRKSIEVWRGLLDRMVVEGLDREAVVVGFGGGTVLDVAGFAAACYLRGIRWISIPTTLLAMVDAAHGGKTGIDHDAAKNLVGAFHPPVTVLLEPSLLATLPAREVRSGLAEVVKHGVIGDPGLLEMAGRDDPATFVERAAQVKLDIVERDPREEDERRLLNLGHTLGHAIEIASDYALSHGEAVAVGLRAACRIAADHCGFRQGAVVHAALDRCELPATARVDAAAVRAALAHDKKRKGDRLHWVLPVALGHVRVFDDVPAALVEAAMTEVLA